MPAKLLERKLNTMVVNVSMYPEVPLALMLLLQWIYLKQEDCAEFHKTQTKQDCEIPCYSRKTGMKISVNEETTPCNFFESASQTTL